jgi:hypothetical protein
VTAGGCLCGAVRFRVEGPLTAPVACHCDQCRRRSGHFAASTSAPRGAVAVTGDVRWYLWKPGVRSGFCPACGAQLFWDAAGAPELSIEMGALDDPTGLRLSGHIFTDEKGDYYAIADGLPTAPHDREAFA